VTPPTAPVKCELCAGRGGRFVIVRDNRRKWIPCKCTRAGTKTVVSILHHAQRRSDSEPFALPTDAHQLAMPTTQPKEDHMARRTRDDDDDRESRRRTSTATKTRRESPNGKARTRREEYTEDPGWGSLFHRPDNEGNQPAYTGQGLDIDGNPIELAIWIRKSRNGKKYLRIHIQEPYEADDAGGDIEDDDDKPRRSRARARDDRPEEDGADYDEDDDEQDIPF
jgi:hypothetical protein